MKPTSNDNKPTKQQFADLIYEIYEMIELLSYKATERFCVWCDKPARDCKCEKPTLVVDNDK